MAMYEEQEESITKTLIFQALNNKEDLELFIEHCYVLFMSAEKGGMAQDAKEILEDQEFIRKTKFVEGLKKEGEGILFYYGDNDQDENFKYKAELEKVITGVRILMLKNIAEIIKEQKEEEIDVTQ